jgi:peptidoglycan hydrolase-like protein with peptidoglycan-binding domain
MLQTWFSKKNLCGHFAGAGKSAKKMVQSAQLVTTAGGMAGPDVTTAGAAAAPRDVIVAALRKGLDGGMSGAAAMTIQVRFSNNSNNRLIRKLCKQSPW